ncbi:MAG TPA: MFS transporter, partial [Bacteroidetes bacterium]|nr:MFS transporter [Bacteroidota bacterium]
MNDELQKSYRGPFVLLTLLFFMWGFITVMNDVLIGAFKGIFQLTTFESSLVQAAFFSAFFVLSLIYFIVSSRWGDPINRIGYKNGMVIGLLICGLGCGLFYPAAQMEAYGFFLFALFVLAGGVTILQIAANPYAAILGSPKTASSRLNLSQGFNSLGTTLGPLVGAFLIYRIFFQPESINQVPDPTAVGSTYLVYGFIFVFCAILVWLSNMPAFRNQEKVENGLGALKFRNLRLGIIAIFLYVGAEVACGSFLVQFLGESNVSGMPRAEANKFLAYFWGGLMIGRLMGAVSLGNMLQKGGKAALMIGISFGTFLFIYLITGFNTHDGTFQWTGLAFGETALFLGLLVLNYGAFLLGRSNAARSVLVFSIAVILLLMVAVFGSGQWAFWAVIGTGLFHSIMWSNIFTLAIKDLGKYTSQGSSLLIMAIVGGAV